MLTQEKEKEIVDGYGKIFKDLKIPEGLILKSDFEVDISSGKTKVANVAFGINKMRYAMYPHIECHIINNNMQEVFCVGFLAEENSGTPLEAFNSVEDIKPEVIFDIKDLEKFIKKIKLGEVRVEVYKNEKESLEKALSVLNKMLEENNIKL